MTVPDEAVEAAATRLYPAWETSPADWKDYFKRKATEALEAAAPFIAAQALEAAADGFHARLPDGTGNGRAYNSYTVATMLREQAVTCRSEQ